MDTIVPASVAAFVVDCTIFPLDTVKSRIQAADYATRYPNGRGLYSGLWQGFGPVVLATLPSAALFFTTYEHAKATLTSPSTPIVGTWVANDGRATALAHTASSALAELSACVILTPAETIKQQRQVARASSASTVGTLLSAMSARSLWRGYWALAGRNLPFTAMQFPMYEYVRARLGARVGLRPRTSIQRAGHQGIPRTTDDVTAGTEARRHAWQVQQQSATAIRRGQAQSGPPAMAESATSHYAKAGAVSGASAAFAGGLAALITTPLDLVKTRIMLSASDDGSSKAGTIRALTRDIWQREGVRGFMRGATLRSAWTALGAGIYLGSYETGREWWNDAGHAQASHLAERANEVVDDVRSSS